MTGIAIVGMGCRFPGAQDVGAYWRNMLDARSCFSEIPRERWNHDLFYDPSPRAIDKTYARKVGLLDDVQSFAALHYGIAPLRATVMDPQHRLLLDAVRVAFEDAGFASMAGSRTGVFVGASVSEHKDLITTRLRAPAMFDGQWGRAPVASPEIRDAIVEDVAPTRAFSIAGNLLNMAAATVANTFDLRGQAFTIDAACSSSLVATFEAVLSLRARVCDVAVAGGVYLNLTPDNLIGFARIGAISPTDACRPFDARSDGFVLGEGVGAVVLKRLDDAMRDGDHIYAVIRGAGINNDGRSEGPMTPRLEGQLDAIRCAYADCDIDPESIGFIEAHGTATTVGDAIELGALHQFFAERARRPIDCWLSSVKANIGHTMSAAGVAGLIKTALVLEKGTVPPQAQFACPHEALAGSGLKVPTAVAALRDGPRRAAVSSFGFGGTNCHLVLEQAPERPRPTAIAIPRAFVISAPTPELLAAHIGELATAVDEHADLADVAHTLARRQRFAACIAFSATTLAELRTALEVTRFAARAGASRFSFAAKPEDAALLQLIVDGETPRPSDDAALCWLPPTPLVTERYWCVARRETSATPLPELGIQPTREQPAVPAAPPPVPDDLESRVIDLIAAASSFPREQITKQQQLFEHLGFDSLMVAELIDRAGDFFEGTEDISLEQFPRAADVGDVIRMIRRVSGGRLKGAATEHPAVLPEHYSVAAFPEYAALRARMAERAALGLEEPYFQIVDEKLINFSTYNYLGLSGDPAVSRAAIDAIGRYGTSVSASRVAAGEKPLHRELETEIASFLGCGDALVMVSGHSTNVSVIGHLCGPGDLVFHDSLAHDSILGGIALSGAKRRSFAHNDWRALDEALREVRGQFRRVLIAIEGVYSMDGDIPDLPGFVEVKKRHKALLYVDEAHSLGVLGKLGAGIGELFDVARSDVDVWMGTLSKALASCGGYIAGSRALVEYLKFTTPGFLYSVGLTPSNAAAALAALRELRRQPQLVAAVQERARLFLSLCRERGLPTGTSDGRSAVVPCIIGDSARCWLVSAKLTEAGINVQPIVYPAVEEQLSRLRFFISARHTEAQLRFTADTLAAVLA